MRLTTHATVAVALASASAMAQIPSRDSAIMPLTDRMVVASRIYAITRSHFALWDRVPDLYLDDAYRGYLDEAIASDRREAFDRATLAFIARLRSGHTWFDDRWLEQHHGQPVGFDAEVIQGQWVVIHSQVPGVGPGDVLQTIDGQPIEQFFQGNRRFISASNDREARDGLFQAPYLFPPRFTLALADGREVAIDRSANRPSPVSRVDSRWLVENRIAYMRLPSFGDMAVGLWARARLDEFRHATAIVIDLRGNQGGIEAAMEETRARLLGRTFARWIERTPAHIGRLDTDGAEEPVLTYRRAPRVPRFDSAPDSVFFVGRLVVLIDGACASACEDFAMSFKGHPRATLVGDTTAGTFSETVHSRIGDMTVSIASTEVYFADGATFEGVGIAPDIVVQPTRDDIRAGRDPVLARALRVAEVKDR